MNTLSKSAIAASAAVFGLSTVVSAEAPARSLVQFATEAAASSVTPTAISGDRSQAVNEEVTVVEPVDPTASGDITITPTPPTGGGSPRLPPVRPPFRPTIRSPFTP